ncbi:MAG: hypothetical protein ACTSYG_06585, partial [Candidatus Heimdallarchaeota archaeon]
RVPSCVSATHTFINQYKSLVNDKNCLNLSWRKVHAETGEYGRGRNVRSVVKYLQKNGQPQDKYCKDDAALPEKEFMNVNLNPEGIADASKRKVGIYTFLQLVHDEIFPAVVKEPIGITLGGTNEDWQKPFNEIVQQTKKPQWWHSVCLWDYNLDEGWIGIYNWWNDGYRRISINYKLTSALTIRDLPDNNNNMLKLIKTKESDEQYFAVGENRYRIPDSETLHFYKGKLGIVGELQIISNEEMNKFAKGEDVPSIKLMRWINSGKEIINDIFE